ncbi:DUF559 domain-containing protein [Muricauda sp. JGD-17]|uniref:Ribonuclease P protein component n=1 Tax=Flagellimonas ochracea TaxID=2696472 RepID=A0A964TBA5_9FLAO|nr:ribonuclease P protein component [Allomuricauda ochracea]NAY91700.1 DUF559 domain-containing protein [Allomuricauda ochracea]
MKNKIIPYNPKLKEFAKQLRKNSTLSEVLLWQKLKQRALGVQFHRQVPLLEFIVDFYCYELKLAIEIDGISHDYKYEKDLQRECELAKVGVQVVRFSDNEVKDDMFHVLHVLKDVISQIRKENDKLLSHSLKSPKFPQGDTAKSSFPKKEKLKSRALFKRLFDEGKNIREYPLKLMYIKTYFEEDVPIKAGFVTPKKKFKSAVSRNRIKRLMREAYRLNKPLVFNNMEGKFAFLFLYIGDQMPNFKDVNKGMKQILASFINKECNEKNA